MSKSEIVRNFLKNGDVKKALCEAKNFRIGVSKEQRSNIVRAYECIVHPDFYKQIGKNIQKCIDLGLSDLKTVVNYK